MTTATRAMGGEHAAIVAAYESLVRTSDEVAAMNDWYRTAETELRAARRVMGVLL